MKRIALAAATAVAMLFGSAAQAGPVIIDGTDANDHGSVSGGANVSGWLYMQRALENLAGAVSGTVQKTVHVIGSSANGGQAGTAIQSAFTLSTLAGTGWNIVYHDGVAAINAFMPTLSTTNTGILYLSTGNLSSGDMDSSEMAALNAFAANINTYVGGAGNAALGGGLFAMGESGTGAYGWLSTLIPGIVSTDLGGGGIGTAISLTAAGNTAFPLLTNADIGGATPWHNYFSGNLGGLSVLGIASQGGVANRAVIIGGGAGTVIGCGQPGQPACPTVPEPGSLPLLALAGLGLVAAGARRRKSA